MAIAVLCIVLGGVVAQWVAWHYRLPAIVLLFALGLAVGPGLGLLHPSAQLGGYLQPMVSLAVAIIVFEGGLALDFRELRAAGEGVLRLTALALPINWCLGTLAAHYVGQLGWGPALLFGAITVVTGPTVVLPLLRHTRLQQRTASFLRWEAILNDPVGAILATLVLQILLVSGGSPTYQAGATQFGDIAGRLLLSVAASATLGVLPALLVRTLFLRDLMPEILKTPVLLALALSVFVLANLIMDGAGLMAATAFGMALANLGVPGLADLRRFKESLVVLVVSALFITLTADLQRDVLGRLSWPILGLTASVLFLVRPAAIVISTLRSNLTVAERLLAAWIAPRGIVAAAVAGVAGLRLQQAGYPSANLVTPSVFAVIAATMVLHGFSLRPLARRLRLTLSDEPAVAIVGASAWSTDLAAALQQAGVRVMLVDTFPGALDAARALRVPVLQAEILSRHGGERFEESPVDYLIAATPDAIYNGLLCARLAPELGRERVFQLSPGPGGIDRYRGLSRDARGKLLGEAAWTVEFLEDLHEQGWRFRVTTMPAEEQMSSGVVPEALEIALVRGGASIVIRSAEDVSGFSPQAGDVVVSLAPPASSQK